MFNELEMSKQFIRNLCLDYTQEDLKEIEGGLQRNFGTNGKIMWLKRQHNTIYIDYYVTTGDLFGPSVKEVKANEMNLYVLCHLQPMLTRLHREGELSPGWSKTIKIDGENWKYTGDFDSKGNATGWGSAMNANGETCDGTFLDNLPEGILRFEYDDGKIKI